METKQNKRVCELVISSHETNAPVETDNTYFRLKGFPNLGNTCFINSVLQCVFRISYFQTLLRNYVTPKKDDPDLMTRLQNLYNAVNLGESISEHLKMVVVVSKVIHVHNYGNILSVRSEYIETWA